MTIEEFQTKRTEIISRMLDNPDEYEIYPTTKCFNELDELFLEIVGQHNTDLQEFAEWCMRNYKRMHELDEYKERFDHNPAGKRYNISDLKTQWELETGRRVK